MRIGSFYNSEDGKIFHDYWYAKAVKMRLSPEFLASIESRYDEAFKDTHPLNIKLPADNLERKRS